MRAPKCPFMKIHLSNWGYRDMLKINIENSLLERAKKAAETAGYSSVDEFIAHCVENELKRLKVLLSETQVADQLRGLGYLK